jgi:Gpi18-like mannosyltransferase
MKKILVIFTIWLVSIFLVNKLSVKFISDRTSYELPYKTQYTFSVAPFLNMDGRKYINIACNGYFKNNSDSSLKAFFPVYPILISFFSVGCKINPVLVGLGISLISFITAIYLLWKLLDTKIRDKTILLLLFFPTSFFFAAYYTESVFLLFSVLFFWFLSKKKIFYASVFAALATGTRIVGLALLLPIFYETYLEYKKTRKIHFEAAFAPLGLIFYSIYNWISSGNLFGFLTAQKNWDRDIGISAPFHAIGSQISSIISGPLSSYDSPFVYPVILIEFVALLYLLTILYFSYKKIDKTYWLYLLGSIVIILFGGILSATPRYALVLFPCYIFLATKLNRKSYLLFFIISLLGFIFMAALFLRGYWIS